MDILLYVPNVNRYVCILLVRINQSVCLFLDKNFTDGFDRASLVKSVNHVIKERFWWPQHVADVVLHAYTDWTRLHDPMANRNAYKQVNVDVIHAFLNLSLYDLQLCGAGP